jgi:hypothetical protein
MRRREPTEESQRRAIRRRIAAVDESAQFSAFLAQRSMEEAQQSNAMDTEDTGLSASDSGSVQHHSTQVSL